MAVRLSEIGLKQPRNTKNAFFAGYGWNSFFFYYDGLQPKMSTGKIKEHECTVNKTS